MAMVASFGRWALAEKALTAAGRLSTPLQRVRRQRCTIGYHHPHPLTAIARIRFALNRGGECFVPRAGHGRANDRHKHSLTASPLPQPVVKQELTSRRDFVSTRRPGPDARPGRWSQASPFRGPLAYANSESRTANVLSGQSNPSVRQPELAAGVCSEANTGNVPWCLTRLPRPRIAARDCLRLRS